MPEDGLRELYIDELKGLYNADNELLMAWPKNGKTASSNDGSSRAARIAQAQGSITIFVTFSFLSRHTLYMSGA